MTEARFEGVPLIGILRGTAATHLAPIIEAVQRGGMTHLEITMNSAGAEAQIGEAVRISEGKLRIGAGTVTKVGLLERALAAGAEFIVTPCYVPEVIRRCVARGIPVFPGALSPTEICEAWELGATMVKVFPGEMGGAGFIRALKGPFPEVELLPTGGVDLESLEKFLEAGAAGAGIGSPLFRKERIESQDWPWLEQQVKAFVKVYRRWTSGGVH